VNGIARGLKVVNHKTWPSSEPSPTIGLCQ
jgi:hypothetical protein